MVPKLEAIKKTAGIGFRAVLFRMVPKHLHYLVDYSHSFRAVLFRMVPKLHFFYLTRLRRFRAVLFRMVPKLLGRDNRREDVLELCCFEWFQNQTPLLSTMAQSFRAVLFRMVPKLVILLLNSLACFRAVLFRMVPKQNKLKNKH